MFVYYSRRQMFPPVEDLMSIKLRVDSSSVEQYIEQSMLDTKGQTRRQLIGAYRPANKPRLRNSMKTLFANFVH